MRVGSLFSGCLGLDLGMEAAGFETAWVCENDRHCQEIIRARRPHLTIHDDVRDLKDVEPVDVLAGGFPCQDLSYAGRGKGLDGDRSGLWFSYADAIRALRPGLVLVENVPGLATRGLGRVLYDLAEAGYVGSWVRLRASDVGAPHGRERIFILAADAERGRGEAVDRLDAQGWQPYAGEYPHAASDSQRVRVDADGRVRGGGSGESRAHAQASVFAGTEVAFAGDPSHAADADESGVEAWGDEGSGGERSRVQSVGSAASVGGRSEVASNSDGGGFVGAVAADESRRHGERVGGGGQVGDAHVDGCRTGGDGAVQFAATSDAGGSGRGRRTSYTEPGDSADGQAAVRDEGERSVSDGSGLVQWGTYEPAVRQWERIFGRPAPRPTDDRGRLSPEFVEWMMGFPQGWTDGVSRTARLRMLGNAVQVQCGTVAGMLLREMVE